MSLFTRFPTPEVRFGQGRRCPCHLVRTLGALLLLCVPAVAQPAAAPIVVRVSAKNTEAARWSEPLDLLEEDLTEHWKHFSSVNKTSIGDVWVRHAGSNKEEARLVCLGDPKGFLYTEKVYREFDLSFEWQIVSDPNGNSGVLVLTQDDLRLWPTGIQVQLHQPAAGSVFPSGGAFTENTVKREGLARPVGEWNECRIVSEKDRVLVHINGTKAGEVTGCSPNQGRIAIQSEGSEVHFRRIQLREPRSRTTANNGENADTDGSPVEPNPDDSAAAG